MFGIRYPDSSVTSVRRLTITCPPSFMTASTEPCGEVPNSGCTDRSGITVFVGAKPPPATGKANVETPLSQDTTRMAFTDSSQTALTTLGVGEASVPASSQPPSAHS